jgi:hypothetical protein
MSEHQIRIRHELDERDRIVAVVAEPASGPGWANTPLWIIMQDESGKLRRECLQPDEQSDGIRVLYATAAAVHGSLVKEVEALVANRRPPLR